MHPRSLAGLAGALVFGLLAATRPGWAGGDRVVVELFTSQGCYSCPPAERFLGELAGRADVIALEFHVDYWDDLVYGAAGKWRDPFSDPAFSDRQRAYNMRIRGQTGVYTPQMVVGGRFEAVGSRRDAVERAIARAGEAAPEVEVSVAPGPGGYRVRLAGNGAARGGVWLVRFRKTATTRVRAGENRGKTLVNHNIVTEMRRIGEWEGARRALVVPAPAAEAGAGCAVIVQAAGPGPVLGAALCPEAGEA